MDREAEVGRRAHTHACLLGKTDGEACRVQEVAAWLEAWQEGVVEDRGDCDGDDGGGGDGGMWWRRRMRRCRIWRL